MLPGWKCDDVIDVSHCFVEGGGFFVPESSVVAFIRKGARHVFHEK
jgi:hypothetical protein